MSFILIMLALVIIGMPVSFTLGISSLLFFLMNDISLGTFAQKMAMSVDSFSLLALPFFVLAGNLMNTGGVTKRLFKLADAIFEGVRGGITYVCIVSGALFSAMSGSAIANAAGLGTIQIEALEERGYDTAFAACLISSVSILGPVIPPSVGMIVYAVTAGVSVSKMFLGGILPGVVLCLIYAVYCSAYAKRLNLPAGKRASLQRILHELKDAFWALMAPVIILGGIFSGVFTATESGAIACIYTLFVSMFVYKDVTLDMLVKTVLDAGRSTGSILLVSATGGLFGFCLTYAQMPQNLAAMLTNYISNKVVLILLLTLVYLFLGCIMSPTAAIITTVPIFIPICNALGVDLIYFGVLVAILMSIGTITPPVGTVMFIVCRHTGITIDRFTRIMIPWFGMIGIFILILVFFPPVITILPNILG